MIKPFEVLRKLADMDHILSHWERSFVTDQFGRSEFTERQIAKIAEVFDRVNRKAGKTAAGTEPARGLPPRRSLENGERLLTNGESTLVLATSSEKQRATGCYALTDDEISVLTD